jgi:ABC-type nitrate/sulfonate/bicarbonate transport system substrate-binding protein
MLKANKSITLLLVAAVTVLIMSLLLITCAPAKPPQQFTLRIGITGVQGLLPYFIILEQGLDKKYGLEFAEISYPSGDALLNDLVAGKIDMGSCATVSLIAAAEHGLVPSKIVNAAALSFADPDHPYIGMLVAKSVASWQDLKGQQIATNAINSPNTVAIKARLQMEGIHDYNLVLIPFANMGLAVAGGNVAAAALTEPYLTQSLLRNDGKSLGWIVGGPPFDRMELAVMVFDANLYRGQPQAVKVFLRGYLEALKWIGHNTDGARRIMSERLNLSAEVRQKISMPLYSSDGHNDPALLENMQSVMVGIGMQKSSIPVSQLYDETLLSEVLSERR